MNQIEKYLTPKVEKVMVTGRIPIDLKRAAEEKMRKQDLSWADLIEAAAKMLIEGKTK